MMQAFKYCLTLGATSRHITTELYTYQLPIINSYNLLPRLQNIQWICLPRREAAVVHHILQAFTKQICLCTPIRIQAVQNVYIRVIKFDQVEKCHEQLNIIFLNFFEQYLNVQPFIPVFISLQASLMGKKWFHELDFLGSLVHSRNQNCINIESSNFF